MKKNILSLIIFFIVVFDSYGFIRYVKPTASGTGDGSTWANASADIQAMIIASSSGDEVWVASGLYKPLKDGSGNASPANVQNKVFWIKSGVKLYGGFAGTETLLSQRNIVTNKTIFSGDIDNNDINTDGNNIAEVSSDIQGTNVYQLLAIANCDKTTIVDGIILTAAQGVTNTSGTGQTINGTTIFPYFGSAISMSSSYPLIKNCILSGNNSYYGAAYHNVNSATGYVDSIKVVSTVFTGNTGVQGGAMFMHRGHTFLNNVVMYNNNATAGGAINISSNMASTGKITIVNSSIVNNYSVNYKSIYIQQGTVKFYNDIIYNEVPYVDGSINKVSSASITLSYSVLQRSKNNGIWNAFYGTNGGNNHDLNPLFVNIASPAGADGNYLTADDGLNITSCSPALNTGTNYVAGTYPSVINEDILNNTRPLSNGVADIGAYEFQSSSTRPDDATNQQASTNAVTCGQSVNLSATCASGTVTWYTALGDGNSVGTGSPLSIIPISNPTIYYAACESGSNCVSLNRMPVNSIAVTLPATPSSITASNSAICPNTQVTLNASCIAPTSPEWYNGAGSTIGNGTSILVSVSTTTIYSVRCKDGVCLSNAGTVQVNVLSTPTGIVTSPTMICLGQQVSITASCSVGTVQWFDDSVGGNMVGTGSPLTITPTFTTTNYYRYFPSCTNGTCTSNRAFPNNFILFAPPVSVAVSQSSICQGTTISLSANCATLPLGSYAKWYDAPSGGTLLGTGSPLSQTPTVTTTYYVECFNNTPNCATPRVATQQVVVSVPVTAPTSVTVDKTSVCPNVSIALSATCATGVVSWYNQATGGTSLGTGTTLAQNPSITTTYYAACESGTCTPSIRVATSQVVISAVGSNLNLTTNISGTSIQASSNTIVATNSILSGANVKYLANNSITLSPLSGNGFNVDNGAVFEAKITPLTSCN